MTVMELTVEDPTTNIQLIHAFVTVIGYVIAGIFIYLYINRKKIVEGETRKTEEKKLKEAAQQHAYAHQQFQQPVQQQFHEHGFVNQHGGRG